MFRGDLHHTGIYNAPGVPNFKQIKWKFHTGGVSSPEIASGIVYFGGYDSNCYAVDASTGQLKWKFQAAGERRYAGKHLHPLQSAAESMPDPADFFLSSPSVWNGAVYLGSGDGIIDALDANSGALKWKFATGDVVRLSPTISDGTLFTRMRMAASILRCCPHLLISSMTTWSPRWGKYSPWGRYCRRL